MKKILLILALLPGLAFATTNNLSGNFSAGSILATDTVILAANAVVDGGPYTFKALWIPAGTDYTLTESGTSILTLTGNGIFWKDSSTGAKTYPDSIAVLNTSGQMRISSQAGAFGFSSGTSWHFAGNDTIYDFKGMGGKHLHKMTKTVLQNTTSSTGFLYVSGTMLVLEENAEFIVNSNGISFNFNADGDFISMANGASISGSGSIRVNAGSGADITVDTFCYSGTSSGGFSFTSSGNIAAGSSVSLTQGICCMKSLNIYKASGGFGFTFNSENYPMNGTTLMNGNGSSTSGANCTFNYGSSILSFPFGFLSSSQNVNQSQINWQTCTASWGGNFTYGTNTTADPGTSLHTFNGTGAQVITSAGKSFYDLTINNTGSDIATPVSFADSATLTGDLTLTDGPVNFNGIGISAVDYTYTTADSVRDGRLWLSGNYTRAAGASKCDTSGQHIRFSAAASHTMTAAGKVYAKVTTSGPLTITGGATIAALSYGIDGIPVTVAEGTTITVGTASIGGTSGSPDTLQGAGAGATLDLAGDQTVTWNDPVYVTGMALAAGDVVTLTAGIDGGGNTGAWIFQSSGGDVSNPRSRVMGRLRNADIGIPLTQ